MCAESCSIKISFLASPRVKKEEKKLWEVLRLSRKLIREGACCWQADLHSVPKKKKKNREKKRERLLSVTFLFEERTELKKNRRNDRNETCLLAGHIKLERVELRLQKLSVMLLTIIVFYSFIVRCLKRENKLIAPEKPSEVTSNNVTSASVTSNSTSSSTTTSIAYNHHGKGLLKDKTLSNRVDDERAPTDKAEKDNPNDSSKEPYSDDEVADDNQFDEEEFYNIIATKAAAFQSKRNSSTSTVSSGSIYDDTYRTKRNSLRSQSSTCSEIVESSTGATNMSDRGNRRSSEDRIQNRKLTHKTRRLGFTTLSKRRRTTGRYFEHSLTHSYERTLFTIILLWKVDSLAASRSSRCASHSLLPLEALEASSLTQCSVVWC